MTCAAAFGRPFLLGGIVVRVTQIVVLAVVVLVLAYDLYAYLKGGQAATVSWVIWTASKDTPVIPFLSGVLCGHLFWRMSDP